MDDDSRREVSSWASSPAVRRTMRSNRRVDTVPEVRLRAELHRNGLRFRKDFPIRVADGTVRPDVVFTRARVAVFVDGCFWHRCPVHGTSPKANAEFWANKLDTNVQRDRRSDDQLRAAGWRVVRIWEHEDSAQGAAMIANILRS
jgi:DNA mismatch endonuclease (patch repair protein)